MLITPQSWPEAEHTGPSSGEMCSLMSQPKWIYWILLPLLWSSSGHVTLTAVCFIKERTSNRVWILGDRCLMSSCALSPSINFTTLWKGLTPSLGTSELNYHKGCKSSSPAVSSPELGLSVWASGELGSSGGQRSSPLSTSVPSVGSTTMDGSLLDNLGYLSWESGKICLKLM